eukprot:154269-Chlamydomonas_euryale.AAC.8
MYCTVPRRAAPYRACKGGCLARAIAAVLTSNQPLSPAHFTYMPASTARGLSALCPAPRVGDQPLSLPTSTHTTPGRTRRNLPPHAARGSARSTPCSMRSRSG